MFQPEGDLLGGGVWEQKQIKPAQTFPKADLKAKHLHWKAKGIVKFTLPCKKNKIKIKSPVVLFCRNGVIDLSIFPAVDLDKSNCVILECRREKTEDLWTCLVFDLKKKVKKALPQTLHNQPQAHSF